MGSLQFGIDDDATAALGDAQPELDILDVLPFPSQSAFGDEGAAPDGANSGPEGLRRPGRVLMHVVVQQVAVVADDAATAGAVVIGSDDRRDLSVIEMCGELSLCLRGEHHVRIDKDDDIAIDGIDPAIPRPGRPQRGPVANDPGAGRFRDL